MIILCCPNCEGAKTERYEGSDRAIKGDWFRCKDCNKKFPLKRSSYREEHDVFDS